MTAQKIRILLLANSIFTFHTVVVLVILFGWLSPAFRYLYLTCLILTLVSELAWGYCFLTKWEFDLRKKVDPGLDYDYSFLSFYGHKYLGTKVSARFVKYAALVFLCGSLAINLIFYAKA